MSAEFDISLEQARWAAMIAGDVTVLAPLLDDEMTWTHANGHLDDKHGFLSRLSGGGVRYLTVERTEEMVRVVGPVAVVTGLADMTVIIGEERKALSNRYTATWVGRDKQWRLFAWHSTPVATR